MENNSQPYYIIFIIKALHFQSIVVSTNKVSKILFSINYQHFQSIYAAVHLGTSRATQQPCEWALTLTVFFPTKGEGRETKSFAEVYIYLANINISGKYRYTNIWQN